MDSEEELELQEMDSEEESNFSISERKIVTQPYDLSIQTLLEQWDSEILILPEMQREYVWDNGRASRLIESFLLNIPVPVLYFSETEDAKYEIIDGHQRVRSVVRYLKNEFGLSSTKLLSEYQGKRFHQLPAKEQRHLKTRTLRAIVIGNDSHPNMKFEVFERLNSGAIALNAQELRNSLYRGTFNKLLHDCAKNSLFREIIGTKTPRKRMVDEELILRFFALKDKVSEYRTPLKRFLNEYMSSVKNISADKVELKKQEFESTITRVHKFIGQNAFRIIDSGGNAIEKPVNRAMFDSQMMAFNWISNETARKQSVLKKLSELYSDPDFLDTVRRATGDRSRLKSRLRKTVEALETAGLQLNVPIDLSEDA